MWPTTTADRRRMLSGRPRGDHRHRADGPRRCARSAGRAAGRLAGRATRRAPDRYQPGPPDGPAEQGRRVDVPVATAQAEVQQDPGLPHRGSRRHPLAHPHGGRTQVPVTGAQPVGVPHHHPPHPHHDAHELHPAGGDGPYRRAGIGGVADPTVTGAPPTGGFSVRVGDRHVDRGHEAAGSDGGGSSGQRREHRRRSGTGQTTPEAVSRARRCSTALVWICETRLSVTPSTEPISASVRPSS